MNDRRIVVIGSPSSITRDSPGMGIPAFSKETCSWSENEPSLERRFYSSYAVKTHWDEQPWSEMHLKRFASEESGSSLSDRIRSDYLQASKYVASFKKKDWSVMSDYPQVFISLADYLQLATELSGNDPLNLVASYYCRWYWAKKAGELIKQPEYNTDQARSYLVEQVNIVTEIKNGVNGIGEEKGRQLFMKFLVKDQKEIEALDSQQQYDMECQRLQKRVKYLEVACLACPEHRQQLEGLKKKTKKRLLDVMKALKAGNPVPPMQSLSTTTIHGQTGFPAQNAQFAPQPSQFPPSFQSSFAPSVPSGTPQSINAGITSFPPSVPEANPPPFPSSTPFHPSFSTTMNPPHFSPSAMSPSVEPPSYPSSNPSYPPSTIPSVEPPSFPSSSPSYSSNPPSYSSNPPSYPSSNPPSYPPSSIPSVEPPSFPSSSPSFPSNTPSYPSNPSSYPSSTPSFPPSTTIPSSLEPPSFPSSSAPTVVEPPSIPTMSRYPSNPSNLPALPTSSPYPQGFSNPSSDFNRPHSDVPKAPKSSSPSSLYDSHSVPSSTQQAPSFDLNQSKIPMQPRSEEPPAPLSPSSSDLNKNVQSGWEGNIEGMLNVYNKAAMESAASNKELAKMIYQAMINACSSDSRYQRYISGFQDAMNKL